MKECTSWEKCSSHIVLFIYNLNCSLMFINYAQRKNAASFFKVRKAGTSFDLLNHGCSVHNNIGAIANNYPVNWSND